MRLTPTIAAATLGVAALSSAFLVTNSATAGQEDRATGGGQTAIGDKGAGDTIAFTARGTAEDADGQVQYVDRSGDGTGKGQTVRHGYVECLQVEGTMAYIGGVWRQGGEFTIYVSDMGNGAGADTIAITQQSVPGCGDESAQDGADALARGNAQVYDAP